MNELHKPLWVLVAALIGLAYLALKHRRNAANNFYNSFSATLALFQHPAPSGYVGSVMDILIKTHEQHAAAIVVFRRHVFFWQRRAYDRAWEQYCKQQLHPLMLKLSDHDEIEHYGHYRANSRDEEIAARVMAVDNIEKLLSFTKHA